MSWVSASKAHHPAGLVEELHKINNITVDQKQRQQLTSTKLLFFRRFLAVVVRRHPGAAASNLSSKAAAGGSWNTKLVVYKQYRAGIRRPLG
jgi:hypothetical protein